MREGRRSIRKAWQAGSLSRGVCVGATAISLMSAFLSVLLTLSSSIPVFASVSLARTLYISLSLSLSLSFSLSRSLSLSLSVCVCVFRSALVDVVNSNHNCSRSWLVCLRDGLQHSLATVSPGATGRRGCLAHLLLRVVVGKQEAPI